MYIHVYIHVYISLCNYQTSAVYMVCEVDVAVGDVLGGDTI